MGMKAYGMDFGKPPRYLAGYKNGELVGLRTAAEWATALGTTSKAISTVAYRGRTMRNGMSFRKPTEEQMANRKYLRHGVALRQAAREARANNMTYGQLQTKIISAKNEIEVPPHWKKQPPKDDRPGPTKDQFAAYLRARGFDARNVEDCVKVRVPEIRRKYTEPLTELVRLAGYRGSYGWVVRWEEKTE
jgi:hypothetical protein